jgi:hypothetical protein
MKCNLRRPIIDILEWYLHKMFIRFPNKLAQFLLYFDQLVHILQPILHNHIGVIYLLTFVYDIESFHILTFLVAKDLFLLEHAFRGTEDRRLPISAFAFDEYLCLARELLALLTHMADLLTAMSTVFAVFVTLFETTIFVGLFAGTCMTLD